MTKTKKLDMELPKEGRFISSEFPILRDNLNKLDQALIAVEEKTDNKAPLQHTHRISDISGLEATLKGKMAADKAFTFADLSDIEGAKDAANNYVLYKASNNNFTFGSAISLLGEHKHKTEDIVGLDDFRAKINEDLTAYGRLKQANEWQSYNKFTNTVTMSGGLELLGSSSLNITHNNKMITSLSAGGSMLQGPLKVDGEAVYTKSQVDQLIASLVKKPVEILMTESGPIPFPEGVSDDTKVEIWAWGGGGGGGGDGGNNKNGGGGGGGGQHARVKIKVSDLKKSQTVQIGRGGSGGRSNGNWGGDTIIKGIIRAGGGGYGGGNDNTPDGYANAYGNRGNGGVGGLGGKGGGTWKNNKQDDLKNESFIFSGGNGGNGGGYNGSDNGNHGGNSIYGGGGGGGGYFRGKDGGKIGGDGGNGAILLKFFI